MKLKYKLTLFALIIDLFFYYLVFHSGIILPFINPSIEQYNQQIQYDKSFPRDSTQQIIWVILHLPTLAVIEYTLGDIWKGLAVIQTMFIFFGIGSLLDLQKRKKIRNIKI